MIILTINKFVIKYNQLFKSGENKQVDFRKWEATSTALVKFEFKKPLYSSES